MECSHFSDLTVTNIIRHGRQCLKTKKCSAPDKNEYKQLHFKSRQFFKLNRKNYMKKKTDFFFLLKELPAFDRV